MKNLLDSTELTTLFLDNALNVRLFANGSIRVFKLMRSDVGRPITDIASDLLYSELANDAREVLRTLIPHEQQVTSRDGLWFMMRIMPYRTLENLIDGVVVTFVDITVSKKLEAELRTTQAGLYKRIDEQDSLSKPRGIPGRDAETMPKLEETKLSSLRT
jgi:two-component system CheB/CheR fusion protein